MWGLTKTDQEWSEKLDTALTAARRDDLEHGTNAAYVHGCVCSDCPAHQRIRMPDAKRHGMVIDCPDSGQGVEQFCLRLVRHPHESTRAGLRPELDHGPRLVWDGEPIGRCRLAHRTA